MGTSQNGLTILARETLNTDGFQAIDLSGCRNYIVGRFRTSSPKGALESLASFSSSGLVEHPNWGKIKIFVNNKIPVVENNSINRFVHGWIFFSGWFNAIESSAQGFHAIEKFVLTWIDEYSNLTSKDSNYKVIFHDESTAQRLAAAIRLHHICEKLEKNELLYRLQPFMNETAELLNSDEFYAGNNNHGMFQAKSLRDFAIYADWLDKDSRANFLRISLKRISEYFERSFTSEGVHIEHSPSYHLMVSKHVFEHAKFLELAYGFCPPELQNIIVRAKDHAIHCIQPNGTFLPLSDTVQGSLVGSRNNIFDSPEFAYAASCGKIGKMPSERTLYEPNSGYFFHRTSWNDAYAGYLAFISAYNGAYHKHSDDLHLYLWKYGFELLTEAGPFGYQMQDPTVKYAFSQHAHNCIVVDNTSLPRHDRKYSQVKMGPLSKLTTGGHSISATNSRFIDSTHKRSLRLTDDLQDILVEDTITSDSEHKYALIWNFGPDVEVELYDNYVIGRIQSIPVIRLDFSGVEIREILHFSGRRGSRPRGWRFPKFGHKIPTSQIQVIFEGSSTCVKTLITTFDKEAKNIDRREARKLNRLQDTAASVQEGKAVITEAAAKSLNPQSSFGTLQYKLGVLKLHDSDENSRATVRTYCEYDLVGEYHGLTANFSLQIPRPGRYRVRIYPKGPLASIKPFTTNWVTID